MILANIPDILSELSSIIGLYLGSLGAIKLAEPLVLRNKEIIEQSSKIDSGGQPSSILKEGEKILIISEEKRRNLMKSRDKAFDGVILLFLGFSAQIITIIVHLDKYVFGNEGILPILAVSIFILLVDIFVIKAMQRGRKQLLLEKTNYERIR